MSSGYKGEWQIKEETPTTNPVSDTGPRAVHWPYINLTTEIFYPDDASTPAV